MWKNNAYYYKVVRRMNIDDFRAQIKIKKHECLFEENKHDKYFEDNYFDESLTGWIEQIENEKLAKAVKSLPIEDQILISHIVKKRYTQEYLSKICKTSRSNITRRFSLIKQRIKKYLS